MKRLLLIFFLLGMAISPALGQSDLTTFILVRHAEKANNDPRNPSLSEEGMKRADKLSQVLAANEISAIYSTPYKRTQTTVEPVAKIKGLTVENYNFQSPTFIQEMLDKHKGGTILVSGHSNTTPMVANKLLGEEKFAQLDESEYGKIFIVTISSLGNGTVTILNY